MDIKITTTVDSLQGVKQQLLEDTRKLRVEMSRAVNDTAKHGKSVISRLVRLHVPVSKKSFDKNISIDQASPSNLTATISVVDKGALPLRAFRPRQTKAGIRVKFDKKGAFATEARDSKGNPVKLDSAFLVEKLRGHAFARRGARRLPIDKLFGPSALDVWEDAGGPEATRADLDKYLQKRLDYRLGRMFGGN